MDEVKAKDKELHDLYKAEVRRRIDSWEGDVKSDDFQYEPERAVLKAQMKEWFAANSGETDEKAVTIGNKKMFARVMAEVVYEDKVKPNLNAFLK